MTEAALQHTTTTYARRRGAPGVRALDEPLPEQELSTAGAIDRLLTSKQEYVADPGRDSQTHKAQSSQTGVQSIEQLKASQVLGQHERQEFVPPLGQVSHVLEQ